MKKILMILTVFVSVILLSGCTMDNTPTKKVENFLNNYRNLDNSVTSQMDKMINTDNLMSADQKTAYGDVLKRQYQDLTYTIKDERIDGDNATVTAEIEVYDFYKVQTEANKYKTTHESEFMTDNKFDEEKFMEYKLKQMMNTAERVEYTIDISLTKKDNEWTINELDKTTLEKIHGTYNYESE